MSGRVLDKAEPPSIDVLIVVALQDELDAVLAEGGGADHWIQLRDHVHVRKLPNDAGQEFGVAAAWIGTMGAMAAASRATALVKELQPSCLAMCGICAGKRGDVALGDVIVADSVYSFDHGKLKAAKNKQATARFFHEIKTYNLEQTWQMDAATFRRDLDWAASLLPSRPPTKEWQIEWLLRTLRAHERKEGHPPHEHPEHARMFRIDVPSATDWADRIRELRKKKWLAPGRGVLKLTKAGRSQVEEYRLTNLTGARPDPEFQVHVGPIATGNQVIEDPKIFDRLRLVQRKTLGVEMEAVAIGYVGDKLPQRSIVAKAVSDFADHDKDDRFREFACRASAAWLLAFLKRQLTPKSASTRAPTSAPPGDPGPRSPFLALTSKLDGLQLQAPNLDPQGATLDFLSRNDALPGVSDLHRRVERAWRCATPTHAQRGSKVPTMYPRPCSRSSRFGYRIVTSPRSTSSPSSMEMCTSPYSKPS